MRTPHSEPRPESRPTRPVAHQCAQLGRRPNCQQLGHHRRARVQPQAVGFVQARGRARGPKAAAAAAATASALRCALCAAPEPSATLGRLQLKVKPQVIHQARMARLFAAQISKPHQADQPHSTKPVALGASQCQLWLRRRSRSRRSHNNNNNNSLDLNLNLNQQLPSNFITRPAQWKPL